MVSNISMLYPKLPRGGDRTYIISTDKSRPLIFIFIYYFRLFLSRVFNLKSSGLMVTMFTITDELTSVHFIRQK